MRRPLGHECDSPQSLWSRGRDEDFSSPPAEIPACAANAPGSTGGDQALRGFVAGWNWPTSMIWIGIGLASIVVGTVGVWSRAVLIEPGLRPRSPENGNISKFARRLSGVPGPEVAKSGVRRPATNSQKPAIGGRFANIRDTFSESRTAWLGREDSNSDIPGSQMSFEISREFRTMFWKSGLGDFRNYLSHLWERTRPQ